MVKMIMHGCNGAMGQVITALAAEDRDIEIVAGITVIRYLPLWRTVMCRQM